MRQIQSNGMADSHHDYTEQIHGFSPCVLARSSKSGMVQRMCQVHKEISTLHHYTARHKTKHATIMRGKTKHHENTKQVMYDL